jgi:hypothetical protein
MKRYLLSPGMLAQAKLARFLCIAAVPVLIAIGLASHPDSRRERINYYAVLGVVIAFILPMEWAVRVLSTSIEMTGEEIASVRGKRRTALQWSEINSVEYQKFMMRLRLASAAGVVIHIDPMIVGYEEIAEEITRRTGRRVVSKSPSVTPAPFPATRELVVEAPRWYRYGIPVFCFGASYAFCIRWLLAARGVPWRIAVLNLALGILGGWFVVTGFLGHWEQVARRLVLDWSGLSYRDRRVSMSVLWKEIGSARIEYHDGAAWFTVRDTAGAITLELQREWFNFSGRTQRLFDAIAHEAARRTSGPPWQ